METRYLKTLVVAVEEGSFSRAAEVLHITQSAVSQRIKFLEEQYDHQLLDRSGPTLELTPAGQLVLAKARDILRKERELLDSLKGLGGAKRLAICCTPTFGMAYLSQVLSDFIRAHADVADLKFIFQQPLEALRSLRNEEFDLAVLEHCPDQEFAGLDRFVLPDDELLLVAPAGAVPDAARGIVELSALTGYRLFARRDGCSSKEMLRSNLARSGRDFADFEGVMISDDLRFTIESVIAGEGVAFVSRTLVSEHLQAGRLAGWRIEGFDHRRGRSVALLPGRFEDPLIADLLACLCRVVSPDATPELIRWQGKS
ncbi:MAG: LysR family transcriptional regulator [Desulfuromonas sp.]|nr:LysR family transcriptional regulator [Desulfuromonas sp.]